jgi:hypothetical protein
MLGAEDDAQLAFTALRGWLILTHNRKHFHRWHRIYLDEGGSHGGIATLPASSQLAVLAVRAGMLLDWIATQGDPRSRLFSWGALQELLEQGFRLASYSEEDVRLALGR